MVETAPERPHHLATETGIGYRLRGAGLGTPLFEAAPSAQLVL